MHETGSFLFHLLNFTDIKYNLDIDIDLKSLSGNVIFHLNYSITKKERKKSVIS